MKVAFLFPGQGSQKVGMLREWLEEDAPLVEELFGQASRICGVDLLRLSLEGPEEELNLTKNSQPAILTFSALLLRKIPLVPDVVAGHSLGEYSAPFLCGEFRFRRGCVPGAAAWGNYARGLSLRGREPWWPSWAFPCQKSRR